VARISAEKRAKMRVFYKEKKNKNFGELKK